MVAGDLKFLPAGSFWPHKIIPWHLLLEDIRRHGNSYRGHRTPESHWTQVTLSHGWKSLFKHAQMANKHKLYVSGNPSNWCHFTQILPPPPPSPSRTTYCITASPHAQAGFAIPQPASWNGHFCSAACCWSHKRSYQAADPPGRMTWTPWQQPERGSRHQMLLSCSASVRRFTSPRARRWWGLCHSGLTGMMASFWSAATECADRCGAVKAPEVYIG